MWNFRDEIIELSDRLVRLKILVVFELSLLRICTVSCLRSFLVMNLNLRYF